MVSYAAIPFMTTQAWQCSGRTPFTGYRLVPPYPGAGVNTYLEPPSRELLWREIEVEASHADRGRRLFTGTFGNMREDKSDDEDADAYRRPYEPCEHNVRL